MISTSQSGIFALGTASHAYLEFDDRVGVLPVGFSAEQQRLTAMLESMTGIPDGDRDALTIASARYRHLPIGRSGAFPCGHTK